MKSAKPPGDRVSNLMAQQRRMLLALEYLSKERDCAHKAGKLNDVRWYENFISPLIDRCHVAIDELSYMTPRTMEGATFMLVAAYASFLDMEETQDAAWRGRRKRRVSRLMYAVLDYIIPGDWQEEDKMHRIVCEYMPPWDNPHRALANGRTFAEACHDET